MKIITRYFNFFGLLVSSIASAYAMPQKAFEANYFTTDSYQIILDKNKHQPFLLVLWSLDCPPCISELKTLGAFHKQYPQHKIILVSTDTKNQLDEIESLMIKNNLQEIEQWVFDGAFQYIRHSIDPGWYGELPRSYFYKKNQSRLSSSGQLHHDQLINLFSINKTISGSQSL